MQNLICQSSSLKNSFIFAIIFGLLAILFGVFRLIETFFRFQIVEEEDFLDFLVLLVLDFIEVEVLLMSVSSTGLLLASRCLLLDLDLTMLSY